MERDFQMGKLYTIPWALDQKFARARDVEYK